MNEVNGIQIVDRIDSKLKLKKENRTHLASALGIKPQTISAWYTRGTIPSADIAIRIAQELNVSVEWLVFGTEKKEEEYSTWEKQLLSYCKMFDERDRDDIMDIARGKASRYAPSTARKAGGSSA